METIKLAKASVMTSPNPVTLVCTKRPDGKTNLATVSWWTYLSYSPEMIAYAMAKTSYSGEMVRANKEVVLTVPGTAIKDAVMGCGTTTGRDTDKVSKFGVEMKDVPGTEIRIPAHTYVAIHCDLKEFVEVGDHYLYICTVKQVFGDENEKPAYAWNGYAKIAGAEMAE